MARILILDDRPTYRDQLARILAQDGHRIETAADAPTAIDLARRLRPDLLVADWMLNDRVSGLEVAETLHADHPALVTVIITGYPLEQIEVPAHHAGKVTFLEKPFGLERFRELVRDAVKAVHR